MFEHKISNFCNFVTVFKIFIFFLSENEKKLIFKMGIIPRFQISRVTFSFDYILSCCIFNEVCSNFRKKSITVAKISNKSNQPLFLHKIRVVLELPSLFPISQFFAFPWKESPLVAVRAHFTTMTRRQKGRSI